MSDKLRNIIERILNHDYHCEKEFTLWIIGIKWKMEQIKREHKKFEEGK